MDDGARVMVAMFGRLGVALGCLLLVCDRAALAHHGVSAFGAGGGGPIVTIPGTTLECGTTTIDVRADYVPFDRFSDAELLAFEAADIETDSTDLGLGAFFTVAHGVTDNVTVALRLPYIYMDDIRHAHDDEVENEGNSAGIGDLLAISFLRLVHDECRGLDVSAIVGLECPTGRTTDLNAEGEVFELEHQPGSGSWDPWVGLAASKSHDHWSLHGNVLYAFVTEGDQDTELGDVFTYNVALVRSFGDHGHDHSHGGEHSHGGSGHSHIHNTAYGHGNACHAKRSRGCHCRHNHCAWNLMLELNGVWEGKDLVGDELDANSGGDVIFLSPGIQVTRGEHWSTFFSAGLPIYQNVNGANHEVDHRLTLGTSWSY